MSDEPTNAELARGIARVEKAIDFLGATVATKDLVQMQHQHAGDRIAAVESDVADLKVSAQSLARAIADEREARRAAIEVEKARFGVWVRWGMAGIATALGSGLASLVLGRLS